MQISLRISSLLETRALASFMSSRCLPGDCFTLSGKIGVGKTQFSRHFLQCYTSIADLEVPSPTFILDFVYKHKGNVVHHMDLYRLTTPQQLDVLNLDTIFKSDISLIEWPDRLGERIPQNRLDITIFDESDSARCESRIFHLQSFTPRWSEMLKEISTKYEITDGCMSESPTFNP